MSVDEGMEYSQDFEGPSNEASLQHPDISDDILAEFGVIGEPAEIAPQMLERYGAFTDRTSASFPVSDDAQRGEIIQALRAG